MGRYFQLPFEGIKQSLMQLPILAIADQHRPFHVVCDASDFVIACVIMQYDADGAERVFYYQSRQLSVITQWSTRNSLP